MKSTGFWVLIIMSLVLVSCLENQFDTNDLVSENDLLYLPQNADKSTYQNDPYKIIGITPKNENWEIIVEYPGGCAEHVFLAYWNGNYSYARTLQTSLTILHDNKGDNCERLVKDTLSLKMDQILTGLYTDEDLIEVTIVNGFNGKSVTVDPYLAQLSQGNRCAYKATLLGSSCSNGIWQNQWFLLADTIGIHDKVWIQPVRANDSKIPSSGKYEIGFNLLFGFSFGEKVCDDQSESIVVPAAITCANLIE